MCVRNVVSFSLAYPTLSTTAACRRQPIPILLLVATLGKWRSKEGRLDQQSHREDGREASRPLPGNRTPGVIRLVKRDSRLLPTIPVTRLYIRSCRNAARQEGGRE